MSDMRRYLFIYILLTAFLVSVRGQGTAGSSIVSKTALTADTTRMLVQRVYDNGLDTYDYGARQYYPILGRWDRMDPLCEKYYGISPYAYCANNPVRYIDIKGDSIFVLIAPDDAKGNGHMAVLIQNKENRWEYYSKNGTKGLSGLYGKPYNDNKGEFSFSSVDEFMNNNEFNPINEETNQRKYTEGYLIPSTSEEDVDAINGALSELEKNYFVVGSNCAVTVQKALSAAGKNTGNPSNYPLSPFTDNAVPITDYLIKQYLVNYTFNRLKFNELH